MHALHPQQAVGRMLQGRGNGNRTLPHAGSSTATNGSADVSRDPAAPVPGAAGRGDAAHGGGRI